MTNGMHSFYIALYNASNDWMGYSVRLKDGVPKLMSVIHELEITAYLPRISGVDIKLTIHSVDNTSRPLK